MKQVLITGASGYLGMRLARRYLEHTQDWLVLWLHARTEDGFRAKIAPLIPHSAHTRGASPGPGETCRRSTPSARWTSKK